ncbi:SART-1 protein [Hyaloraphidium curvatum]|nr:SART-1 protein [Hyaloraphidium curvatum]
MGPAAACRLLRPPCSLSAPKTTMADAEGGGEISLSIEETNKLRISLGLKPLSLEPSESDKAEKAAEDNFAARREEERKAAEVAELQERLAKSRNKRELKKKLAGKGLGEAEDEQDATLDSLAWVERMKKRQQELAERKQRELEEQDRELQTAAKSAATTAGLRVGHAVDTVLEGGETILVLKDSTIEENEAEGDELISVKLLESEKTKKRLDVAKKKARYDPGAEEPQTLLSQYDETISGPEKHAFVLGEEGSFSVEEEERRRMEVSQNLREQRFGLKGVETNLEYTKMNEIRDYYTQEEQEQQQASFKKVKKKEKKRDRATRTTRILDEDDGLADGAANGDSMETDAKPEAFSRSNATASIEDVNFVDDDDLQGAIARARRLAEKKKARVASTLAVADEILGRRAAADADDGEGGMVIDIVDRPEGAPPDEEALDPELILSDTTEFVRSLPSMSVFQQQQAEQARKAQLAAAAKQARQQSAREEAARKAAGDVVVKEEEVEENGDAMDWQGSNREASAAPSDSVGVKEEKDSDEEDEDHITEEPLVAAGLGATLALLSSRGALEKTTEESKVREDRIKKQQEWIKQQRIKELEKELERKKEKEKNREREKERRKGAGGHQWEDDRDDIDDVYEERKRVRELEAKFRDYKPEINIDYVDEFGRTMNQKEAFKFLSHRFHGKGSGKLKTEKRLQKIADEFREKAASTADTPLGTVNALHERTKTLKQPHVVLQIGNRAAAVAEATKIRPSASQKKKKVVKEEAVAPQPVVVDVSGGLTGQSVDDENREKVVFGLGMKRKADAM